MCEYDRAKRRAEQLELATIEEACEILREEGGVPEILHFYAWLMRGRIAPSRFIRRLQAEKPKRIRRSA